MKLFSKLYDRCLVWSQHKNANAYLGVLSFAEASFFPIPTDVMLAPMVLAKRHEAWRLATIATVWSVMGGLFGYVIGYFSFDLIADWLQNSHYWSSYQTAVGWFDTYGFWVMFLAGFSPIPYKVFTIAAGASAMAVAPFALASLLGRGARYFLVAGLVKFGGPHFEKHLLQYIDRIGWAVVVLAIVAWLVLR